MPRAPPTRSHRHLATPARDEEWERALIEPVLARAFDAPKAATADPKDMRDGEDTR